MYVRILVQAIDSIFHKPDSIFVRTKAKNILFDGLPVDCDVEDMAGSAVCNMLEDEVKELIPDGDNCYKISYFGGVCIVTELLCIQLFN